MKVKRPTCAAASRVIVRNVNTQVKTPQWMVDRLALWPALGVAPGGHLQLRDVRAGSPQPHFDLDKISGGLTVRWGQQGETLKLLNGNTIKIDDFIKVGVIADDKEVESLVSIMGGGHDCRV